MGVSWERHSLLAAVLPVCFLDGFGEQNSMSQVSLVLLS
ncbi:ULP_PROTEASE domain-containing protein [Psidium guajava]|nr:ULP_PROTEASE domain-containing protein [Psidium guajava]